MSEVDPGWTGAVLIGGRSRRMGRDKALMRDAAGQTWLARILSTLRAAGASRCLAVGRAPLSPELRDELRRLDADLALDRRPGLGPLAGLEAALSASPTPWCLVVACDMPAADPALLRGLAARRPTGSVVDQLAFVPAVAGRIQPLQALYHRDLLGAVEARLEREDPRERSLRGLVEDLAERCVQVELSEEASFFNANTPDDLEALSQLDPDARPQQPREQG